MVNKEIPAAARIGRAPTPVDLELRIASLQALVARRQAGDAVAVNGLIDRTAHRLMHLTIKMLKKDPVLGNRGDERYSLRVRGVGPLSRRNSSGS
jgi:hypothetical protein